MPVYVVEDSQTEEPVDSFLAKDLEDAIAHVANREDFRHFVLHGIMRFQYGPRSNVFLIIHMPYGVHYKFEVGEVGK